jgi:hypothetical protein
MLAYNDADNDLLRLAGPWDPHLPALQVADTADDSRAKSHCAIENHVAFADGARFLRPGRQDRRHFLKTGFSIAAASLAGAAGLVGVRRTLAEEAPPETTSVRLEDLKDDGTCHAPIDILDDLLRDEGFADVRFVRGADTDTDSEKKIARGDVDFTNDFAAVTTISIDAGVPTVTLAGVKVMNASIFSSARRPFGSPSP